MSLDIGPDRSPDVGQQASVSPAAPDPVEALSAASGVSAEALSALPDYELQGMHHLEQAVERAGAALASEQMSQETYEATVAARDQIRAEVEARVAGPPDLSAATPEQTQRALRSMGMEAPQDARLYIRGDELVFDVDTHLFGSGATPEIATAFERQIQRDWGTNPETGEPWTYLATTTDEEGISEIKGYTVRFDVNVDVINPRTPAERQAVTNRHDNPEDYDNYVQAVSLEQAVLEGGLRSYVGHGDMGRWRAFDSGGDSVLDISPASHEFGHLLGFGDRYTDTTKIVDGKEVPQYVPDVGYEGNIMAEASGQGPVTQTMINGLAHSAMYQATVSAYPRPASAPEPFNPVRGIVQTVSGNRLEGILEAPRTGPPHP